MKQGIVVLILYLVLLPVMATESELRSGPKVIPITAEDWFGRAIEQIRNEEYEPSLQEFDYKGAQFSKPRLHFANRAQNLRAYFNEQGMELMPRISDATDFWNLKYRLSSAYRKEGNIKIYSGFEPRIVDTKIVCQSQGVMEEYTNSEAGIAQTIVIQEKPKGEDSLYIKASIAVQRLVCSQNADNCVIFSDNRGEVVYKLVRVEDAAEKALNSSIRCDGHTQLTLSVDDRYAQYPISVHVLVSSNNEQAEPQHGNPILGPRATPDWTAESDQANADFGRSVSTAGDVNGDGYSDVIIGAPKFDNGQSNEGRAFVYHGGASGLSLTADWTAESDQAGAYFGYSVSTAGDVNGDGYSDVIVGAWFYGNGQQFEGRAYVYHGSASGLSADADWITETNHAYDYLGLSVSTAGDVNGDGYSDVIVGCSGYDPSGAAFVYHGSTTGLSQMADWIGEPVAGSGEYGRSVSTAGDVNGDGYSDVIVGAEYYTNGQVAEGAAFVYHGSAIGLSTDADWIGEPNLKYEQFGHAVSTAGDVNGDGYSDVIIGAYGSGEPPADRAYVYHGSTTGLSQAADWIMQGPSFYFFGTSVSTAGDVNNDAYADVVIGTYGCHAYVYHGSTTGLSQTADWISEPYQGTSVSTAGDVNGDGYSDVIVGAPSYDNGQTNEGAAFVYHGPLAIENQPPTVEITSPTEDQLVGGENYMIYGTAEDDDGWIDYVEIKFDDGDWMEANWDGVHWTYYWNTTLVENGEHTIYARSFDDQGQPSSIASVEVEVVNYYFVHLSDTHIGASGALESFNEVLDCIRGFDPKPAFVIISGDLVDFAGDLWHGCYGNYSDFKDALHGSPSQLYLDIAETVPVYICPGNHDYYWWPTELSCYDQAFDYPGEEDNHRYLKKYPGTQIFSLNSGGDAWWSAICGWPRPPEGGGPTDDDMDWLNQNLALYPSDYHQFIFIHHPVIYCNLAFEDYDIPLCDHGWWDATLQNNNSEMRESFDLYGVDAVFSGHMHQNWVYSPSCYPDKKGGLSQDGSDYPPPTCFTQKIPYFASHKHDETMYVMTGSTQQRYFRIIEVRGDTTIIYCHLATNTMATVAQFPSSQSQTQNCAACKRNPIASSNTTFVKTARIHVYDSQGNHMGVDEFGNIENQISGGVFSYLYFVPDTPPDALCDTVGSEASIPYGADDYVVKIEGISNGSIDLTHTYHFGRSNVDMDYFDVSITDNSIGTIYICSDSVNPTLYIDDDGDSIIDREIQPDKIIYQNVPYPPTKPSGTTLGYTDTLCSYSTNTTDPENDQVYYMFDWGDETSSDWLGPYNSGDICTASHSWMGSGTYGVRVRAKDIWDHMSLWSDVLSVFIADVMATIDIDPDVLNLQSQGVWITCYIELPEGYSVEDIDTSTVALTAIDGESIEPPLYREGPIGIGDEDEDGIPDLMVKFDRQNLIDILSGIIETPADVELTVIGELADGTTVRAGSKREHEAFALYKTARREPAEGSVFTSSKRGHDVFEPLGRESADGAVFAGVDTIRVIHAYSEIEGPQTAGEIPHSFAFYENYPNPFSKRTHVDYALPKRTSVDIKIYDVSGKLVKTLVSERLDPGYYQIDWRGNDNLGRKVSAGVYFIRMITREYKSQHKVIFVH